jgi:broad specificity phosphatase PhoE
MKEDVALVEQQFGLFDGLSDEELQEKYPNEYEHYNKCERFNGRFWARMPLGESRLDVTLRVHQLFGTWQRDIEKHNVHKLVVISHGVTIRAIVMRWLHHSVEWFEAEKNPMNCSVRLIKDCTDCGYL